MSDGANWPSEYTVVCASYFVKHYLSHTDLQSSTEQSVALDKESRPLVSLTLEMKIERFYAVLGNTIQTERLKVNMSQAKLGERLMPKMTRASIANIEAGKQRVLGHTLIQFSRILDLDLNEMKDFERRIVLTPEAADKEIETALISELSPESAERLMELIRSKPKRRNK